MKRHWESKDATVHMSATVKALAEWTQASCRASDPVVLCGCLIANETNTILKESWKVLASVWWWLCAKHNERATSTKHSRWDSYASLFKGERKETTLTLKELFMLLGTVCTVKRWFWTQSSNAPIHMILREDGKHMSFTILTEVEIKIKREYFKRFVLLD